MLSFIFTVILTAKAIVFEKETGIKEAMILMGMKPWIYWLSWYIKTFLMLLPSLIFMMVSYKLKLTLKNEGKAAIIDKTDPALFAMFLLLHASSLITFTFLCTTFFKKANSAATGSGMLYFFTYLPYIFISLRYEQLGLVSKIASCFVSNLAMCLGVQIIGMFEGQGTGINFANVLRGRSVEDTFSLGHIMCVMVLNNFVHLILTYYFENVLPSDHGISRPWHFMLTWWLPRKTAFSSSGGQHMTDSLINLMDASTFVKEVDQTVFIEDEANFANKAVGIRISNICKVYKQLGSFKQAVKNLSLNIYEGQISVLLGHNGAGKR